MDRFLSIAILSFVLLIGEPVRGCNETEVLVPRIKVTDCQILYTNFNYLHNFDCSVIRRNETYNNVLLEYEVLRDIPEEVHLAVELFTSDSDPRHGKFVNKTNVQICPATSQCVPLPKFELLPTIDKLRAECFKKGLFAFDDMGDLHYEVLSPNIQEIGKYQYSNINVTARGTELFGITLYSEWENLNAGDAKISL